jgi:hypothetical protein
MRRNPAVVAVGTLGALAIASPVLGGPSLKYLVRKEVASSPTRLGHRDHKAHLVSQAQPVHQGPASGPWWQPMAR